jgi:cytochrome P450
MLIGGWIEHKLSPTRYVDDAWPITQRVPKMLAFWRKQYYKDAAVVSAMAKAWWEPCKERVRAGILTPCFATSFVQRYEAEGWSDEDAALVTFGLMLAGAGTTGGTINFFIMACCKFPETMRKAQEEIDRVVGDKRYPTLEDEANLPYVRAMIKENHRWRPISNHGKVQTLISTCYRY